MSNRQVARCGVCIALLAVSAWITVPLGPVPFTMQTFVLALLPQVMSTRDALFTVMVYLLLGAVGGPVFSGFQGGLGVLMGPTGGYLLGFAVGMPVAGAVAHADMLPRRARGIAAGIALLAVSYVLGTFQLMNVYGGASVPGAGSGGRSVDRRERTPPCAYQTPVVIKKQ